MAQMSQQVNNLAKERDYYKEMSEKYFHELKHKDKMARNAKLEHVMKSIHTQDTDNEATSDIEQVTSSPAYGINGVLKAIGPSGER